MLTFLPLGVRRDFVRAGVSDDRPDPHHGGRHLRGPRLGRGPGGAADGCSHQLQDLHRYREGGDAVQVGDSDIAIFFHPLNFDRRTFYEGILKLPNHDNPWVTPYLLAIYLLFQMQLIFLMEYHYFPHYLV